MKENPNNLLTCSELATYLAIPEPTIYYLVKHDSTMQSCSIKIGGRWRFSRDKVDSIYLKKDKQEESAGIPCPSPTLGVDALLLASVNRRLPSFRQFSVTPAPQDDESNLYILKLGEPGRSPVSSWRIATADFLNERLEGIIIGLDTAEILEIMRQEDDGQ